MPISTCLIFIIVACNAIKQKYEWSSSTLYFQYGNANRPRFQPGGQFTPTVSGHFILDKPFHIWICLDLLKNTYIYSLFIFFIIYLKYTFLLCFIYF